MQQLIPTSEGTNNTSDIFLVKLTSVYYIISSVVSVQYCPLPSKEPTSEGERYTMSDILPPYL